MLILKCIIGVIVGGMVGAGIATVIDRRRSNDSKM